MVCGLFAARPDNHRAGDVRERGWDRRLARLWDRAAPAVAVKRPAICHESRPFFTRGRRFLADSWRIVGLFRAALRKNPTASFATVAGPAARLSQSARGHQSPRQAAGPEAR